MWYSSVEQVVERICLGGGDKWGNSGIRECHRVSNRAMMIYTDEASTISSDIFFQYGNA